MKNNRGFTLIELLAVIVIMGILMAIAIPSINLIITDSRKDIYVNSARTFINEAEKGVLDSTFEIEDPDTTYYIHIANLVDDPTNLGKSGFATWSDSYVVATMDLINDKTDYNYYFNSSDMAKWKIELVGRDNLKKSDVYQDSTKKVNFYPVGNRSKVVVYDANGLRSDKNPYIMLSEEKAQKCYTYKSLSDTTVSITGYKTMCGTDVIIPDAIGDKTVVTIDQWAFSNKELYSVYIPDGVKTIGNGAFYNNNLTKLTIPDSVETISYRAFSKNKISKLTLQKTLKTIGGEGFRYNELTDSVEVLVPGSNTTIGNYAFRDNKIPVSELFTYKRNSDGTMDYTTLTGYAGDLSEFSNKTFIIPEKKNNISLLNIQNLTFNGFTILENWKVIIPNTVTTIGQWAFGSSKISSVVLPSNIKIINQGAFYNNNLTSVTIPNGTETIAGMAFQKNQISKLILPITLKTIGEGAFRYNELTDSVEVLVPGPNTTIGRYAFRDNKIPVGELFTYKRNSDGSMDYTTLTGYMGNLSEFSNKTFVIPEKKNGIPLLKIGATALSNFSDLRSWNVTIPDTVTEIGEWAFNRTSIVSVTLPKKLKTIGIYAFYKSDLTSVTIPSEVEKIGGHAFVNNSNLKNIINKTGRSFDWKAIVVGTNSATFETGTIKTSHGDIIVTK